MENSLLQCGKGTFDTVAFKTWMKQVLIPEVTKGKVFILDNASFHKSKKIEDIVSQAGCKMLFLPPFHLT